MGNFAVRIRLIWFEQGPQGRTPSGESRLHGPELHVQNLGDLFIRETFDLAQDDHSAERLGKLPEGGFYPLPGLSLRGAVERRTAGVRQSVAQASRAVIVFILLRGIDPSNRCDGERGGFTKA